MSNKKKGLGRGLSALFGDSKPSKQEAQIGNLIKVAISDLSRNPYQPRMNFSDEKLEELANSIKKNGIIQPIAVRPIKSDPETYNLSELKNKVLGCWCNSGDLCHGEILAKLSKPGKWSNKGPQKVWIRWKCSEFRRASFMFSFRF